MDYFKMLTVKKHQSYSELIWFCPTCGRRRVLSYNTGGKYIIAYFDPPLRFWCCGQNESYQFIEAKQTDNEKFHILSQSE
jgi:hypothetical protein